MLPTYINRIEFILESSPVFRLKTVCILSGKMKIQVVPIFPKTRELEVQLLLWMGKDTWHGDSRSVYYRDP